MPEKIYDSKHQGDAIYRWKNYGLILREGETYKGIYSLYMNTDFCNKCSVKFNDEVYNERRCMDHDHSTGYFRQVLCHKCNLNCDRTAPKLQKNKKINHKWISLDFNKQKSGKVYVSFVYTRGGFKRKRSQSLTTLIALSFIHILQKPI